MMKAIIAAAGLALTLSGMPALAVDGRLDTLPRGAYVCERPGDASTQRGFAAPEEDFKVTNGSAYSAGGKRGTYLRVGDSVTMTSGPHKGKRYELKNERFLRHLGSDGAPTGLRCIKLDPGVN